ncbi:MAG: dihydroorotate dehydrogenase [Candidatus Kariarchaeaceae archaeon]
MPDLIIEKTGLPFMQLISLLRKQNKIKLPVRIGNIQFSNPIGIPSGWADTPEKVNILHNLGAGIIETKTITPSYRKGNPYPRIIRSQNSIINSQGLPNKGLEWWTKNIKKIKHRPIIVSVHGETLKEWEILLNQLDSTADIVELNFSCPNIAGGIMDLKASKELIRSISSMSTTKIWLKISPKYTPDENTKLIESVREDIDGVSAINTVPIIHPKLGNPTKKGGLSGKAIYPKLNLQLKSIRNVYPNHSDLPIFASGGIMQVENAWEIFTNYQAFPLSLTAFLMNGPFHYLRCLQYFLDKMQTDSTPDLQHYLN